MFHASSLAADNKPRCLSIHLIASTPLCQHAKFLRANIWIYSLLWCRHQCILILAQGKITKGRSALVLNIVSCTIQTETAAGITTGGCRSLTIAHCKNDLHFQENDLHLIKCLFIYPCYTCCFYAFCVRHHSFLH